MAARLQKKKKTTKKKGKSAKIGKKNFASKRPVKKKITKKRPQMADAKQPFGEDATSVFYSGKIIADMLGITARHLRRLAAEGVVPEATRGRYPLFRCVLGYVTYLRNNQTNDEHRKKEHTRLNTARANMYELELQKKRGDLYDRQLVDEVLFRTCTIFNSMLDGAASRIAGQLGGGATLRNKLVDEHRNIRKQLAAGLRKFSQRVAESGGDN